MHKEILNKNQLSILPIVADFSSKGFYLAGGTALALQINHRESIDFDIFSYEEFDNKDIHKEILNLGFKNSDIDVVIDRLDEYTFFIKDTKITFLRYPFYVSGLIKENSISLASPLLIGAMKAYELGNSRTWKDYVDLYILLQQYSLRDIIDKAVDIFESTFSEKMFREQLCYFNDIDYTEEIKWRIDNPPLDSEIKEFLEIVATKN